MDEIDEILNSENKNVQISNNDIIIHQDNNDDKNVQFLNLLKNTDLLDDSIKNVLLEQMIDKHKDVILKSEFQNDIDNLNKEDDNNDDMFSNFNNNMFMDFFKNMSQNMNFANSFGNGFNEDCNENECDDEDDDNFEDLDENEEDEECEDNDGEDGDDEEDGDEEDGDGDEEDEDYEENIDYDEEEDDDVYKMTGDFELFNDKKIEKEEKVELDENEINMSIDVINKIKNMKIFNKDLKRSLESYLYHNYKQILEKTDYNNELNRILMYDLYEFMEDLEEKMIEYIEGIQQFNMQLYSNGENIYEIYRKLKYYGDYLLHFCKSKHINLQNENGESMLFLLLKYISNNIKIQKDIPSFMDMLNTVLKNEHLDINLKNNEDYNILDYAQLVGCSKKINNKLMEKMNPVIIEDMDKID